MFFQVSLAQDALFSTSLNGIEMNIGKEFLKVATVSCCSLHCSLTKTACSSPCLSWPVWPSYPSSCYATFSLGSTSPSSSTTTPGSSVSCCSSPSPTDTWPACACASAQSQKMREAIILLEKTTGCLGLSSLNWYFFFSSFRNVLPHEAETAGAIMAFFLSLGLALGAGASFFIRALV